MLQNVMVEDQPSTKSEEMLEQLIAGSVSASSGPVDLSATLLVLCATATTIKDKGKGCFKQTLQRRANSSEIETKPKSWASFDLDPALESMKSNVQIWIKSLN